MLKENITDKRKERHKISQEDFTPKEIVELLYQGSEELFTDFSKTLCDPCAGIFYIIMYCLEQRLKHCKSEDDIIYAISTLYGTELYEDNVEEGKQNLYNLIKSIDIKISDTKWIEIENIINHNFICTDTFKWDYENWCPIKENKTIPLF